MNLAQRGGPALPASLTLPRLLAGACGATVLLLGVLAPGPGGVAGAASPGWITLPQAAPHLPAGASRLGAAPSSQVLKLDVVLAGQNPTGLAQTVAAVSTPGSPDYRHYLTAAQYAAQFGPSPAEVAQVSSTLRSQGLTVGLPGPGSTLLPVSGTASVVSSALGTPLESVRAPGESSRAIVNTASPQIPASLGGAVTGVVGLDGVFEEHAMIKQGPTGTSESPESAPATGGGTTGATGATGASDAPQSPAAIAHAGTPQACPAAQQRAVGGSYTSTQLASVFGLDQVFGQGRTGVGQSIAIVEFEQYAASDFAAFQACYGLSNPIRNVAVDGG
ncbi:MAG TPA: protease pro-enzyme activation domain-containing protein, partial [Acidimicrobiales bacterium]|nr:protease pro-enzyme activation domain-containing protein [Acidimicrobiales bacterium]